MYAMAITTLNDGRILVATCNPDHSIHVRNVLDLENPVVLRGHSDRINAITWLEPSGSRGRLAACACDGTVWLWDVHAGGGTGRQLPATIAGEAARALAWTRLPDGRTLLAVSRGGTIEVWDPDARTLIGQSAGHRAPTWAMRWFPGRDDDLLLVSGGYDGTLRVWRPGLDEVAVLSCQADEVTPQEGTEVDVGDIGLVEGPDDAVRAVVTCFTSIEVWDLTVGRRVRRLADSRAAQAVACLRLPDDRLVAMTNGFGKTARLWDIDAGEVVTELEHPGTVLDSVGFGLLPDGRLLLAVACGDDQAYLWTTDPPAANTGAPGAGRQPVALRELQFTLHREFRHGERVLTACLGQASGRILVATTGLEGQVKVWDVDSGECRHTRDGHDYPIYAAAAIQHRGKMLMATGPDDGGAIRIWDVAAGTLQRTLEGHPNRVRSVSWTHDREGRALLASVGSDMAARVWEGDTGRLLHVIDDGFPYTGAWIFSLKERALLLALASVDGDIRTWDVSSGRQIHNMADRPRPWLIASGPRPDGAPLLALAHGEDAGPVTIWDIDKRNLVSEVDDSMVLGLAWHRLPDGRPVLFSGGRSQLLRVWEPLSGACLATLPHPDFVRRVSVAEFGDRLLVATGCDDGTARLWSADLSSFRPRMEPQHVVARDRQPVDAPDRRPVAVAEAVLLGAACGWHPLGLISDLITLTGPESGPALFDPRLAALAQHPGVARLRGLRWSRPARAAFAALLAATQVPETQFTPPESTSPADQLRVLRDATDGPGAGSAPTGVDVGALRKAADRLTPATVTLLRVIGPAAAADDPLLPLRLIHRAPDLPELTSAQHVLLAESTTRITRRQAVGTSTMRAAGTAGITRRGAPTSLLLTQLALPDDVFDARYAAEQLLHRHHPAGTTPRPHPVTIVLDTTPPTFGPAEGLLRLVAHLMTQVLWGRGARPVLVTLSAPDRARELTQPADLMEVWTSRTLEPPDLTAALDTAVRASSNPTVTLTVHHHRPLHPVSTPQHRLVTTHQPGCPPPSAPLGPDHHHLAPEPAQSALSAVLTAVLSSGPG